jgi:hypothetical protein
MMRLKNVPMIFKVDMTHRSQYPTYAIAPGHTGKDRVAVRRLSPF